MATFNCIYESGQVSVLLITADYDFDHTVTDYNPLPSISFPIKGGFKYSSGKFNSIANSNVILIEGGAIEFNLTKFAGFNHDSTLCFQFRKMDSRLFKRLLTPGQTVQTLRRSPQIENLVRLFLSTYPSQSNLLKDQIIDALLIENILNQKLPATRIARVTPWHNRKIDTAKDYIYSYFTEDISLADISAASHISSFHFSRVFKKVTGYSPYEYLLQVRIVQAQRLLKTGTSVTSTAFEVGFNSIANFSYRFKEIVGTSPSEYQKEQEF